MLVVQFIPFDCYIDGGQKDVLLKRANIKNALNLWADFYQYNPVITAPSEQLAYLNLISNVVQIDDYNQFGADLKHWSFYQ